MIEKHYDVAIETGFARYAAGLAVAANKFSSSIILEYQKTAVNLKNVPDCVIQVMNLGIQTGTTFIIRAEGQDEASAIEAISTHLKQFAQIHGDNND